MEHIAAGSAAIQNVLLGATSRGKRNYWSTGGALLRSSGLRKKLNIPMDEILLGAIFIYPQELPAADVVIKEG